MAVEAFTALILGFVVGIAGGALSAYLGWNKSGEPFDSRKFISGVVTGIVAGVVIVLANTAALTAAADEAALAISLAVIFVAIIGADTIRTSITGAVRKGSNENNSKEEKKPEAK